MTCSKDVRRRIYNACLSAIASLRETNPKELDMKVTHLTKWSAVATLLVACGGPLKYDAISSPRAPGADASIEADVREEQHQTQLELEIDNLPPAERIDPESQHYIVWYRRDSKDTWTRIAALHYDADSREGELHTAVPETAFELWVTVEKEIDVASPSQNVLFEQQVGGG
jgi:hypothetical protein